MTDTRNAIQALRNAGFTHVIMVDAPNWGQDWSNTMRNNAQSIFNSDSLRNTIFSVHMYGVYDTSSEIQSYMSYFYNNNLPLCVGEFGHYHTDGNPDEAAIVSYARQYGMSIFGWSWCGNGGGVEYLDMVYSWNMNSPTSWGSWFRNNALVDVQQQRYTLTVNIIPSDCGSVVLSPSGSSYDAGTRVTLTAQPNSGYVFSNWSGSITGSQNPVTVTMDSNKVINANFVSIQNQDRIVIEAEAGELNGVSVATSRSGFSGTGYVTGFDSSSDYVEVITTVPFSGVYEIFLRYTSPYGEKENYLYVNRQIQRVINFPQNTVFSEISCGEFTLSSGTNTIRIQSYWGWFELDSFILVYKSNKVYNLSIVSNPQSGGVVLLEPLGGIYLEGSTVTLTAIANTGWKFTNWSGDLSGQANPTSIIMTSSKTIIANFVTLSNNTTTYYNLNVNVTPDNGGIIILIPSDGIYLAGSSVTLVAIANEGYKFSHWSGDMVGISTTASIIMDSNKNIMAHFSVSSSTGDLLPIITSINFTEGFVITKAYEIDVKCTDDFGISKVEFYIDGNLKHTSIQSPYNFVLNPQNLSEGEHILMIVVYDTSNQTLVEEMNFIVNNSMEVTELNNNYILTANNDGVNDKINFGSEVEWIKIYNTFGKLVYELKIGENKEFTKKLNLGLYIYKAKLKDGRIKIGSISVVK